VKHPLNTTYRVRRSVIEPEVTWTVTSGTLEHSAHSSQDARKTADKSYSLTDMRAIRLAYDPSDADSARHWCDITTQSGEVLRVVSTHYQGFAAFEDRGAAYAPWVRALIAATAAANPACVFEAGKPIGVYYGEIAFLTAAAVFLIGTLLLTGAMGIIEIVVIKLILLAVMLPVLRDYLRKNRPRRFTASTIPVDSLPSGAG
jgi:hypothetical protein